MDDFGPSDDQLTFSQRHGYTPLPKPMQIEEIDTDLRRELWNTVRTLLIEKSGQRRRNYYLFGVSKLFVQRVIGAHGMIAEDEVNITVEMSNQVAEAFKNILMESKFNKLLDFLEIIVNDYDVDDDFGTEVAALFDRHAAAYGLDASQHPFHFYPRSSKEQGAATQRAIKSVRDAGMDGAATHLRDAADHINASQYADSIADSIHAVESVARTIAPEGKGLGDALKLLKNKGLLRNEQLKVAFEKLYAYTNSEPGIRHALRDRAGADAGLDEAMFMYGACASFADYLVSKHRQSEGRESGV